MVMLWKSSCATNSGWTRKPSAQLEQRQDEGVAKGQRESACLDGSAHEEGRCRSENGPRHG